MIFDTMTKLSRVRSYLDRFGYTGAILCRQDNFSWITSGGSNRVIIPSPEGAGTVVITQDAVYLVAQVMDGGRIMDEEMGSLAAQYVPLGWYEESVIEKAAFLAGSHPASDVPLNGSCQLKEIYALHFPYTDSEMATFMKAGELSDEVVSIVAREIKPGMDDREAEAMLLYEYAKRGVVCDVVLVGSDERVFKYRHPAPCGAKLGRYVLLTPATRYRGLHCNLARSVYFGNQAPDNVRKAFDTVTCVSANCISRCITGVSYKSILEEHKRIFNDNGYSDEWRGHYPGGTTGYFLCQPDLSLDETRTIGDREAFEWFITVPGAKAAELTVKNGESVVIASCTGKWPLRRIERNGVMISLPDLMLR